MAVHRSLFSAACCALALLAPTTAAAATWRARARAPPRAAARLVGSLAPHGAPNKWRSMRSLGERLKALQDVEVEHLMGFFNPTMGAFAVEPRSTHRVSVVSTANVVRAMLANEEGWRKVIASGTELSARRLLRALLEARWTFDPLQTPVALEAVVALHAGLPDDPQARLAFAHTCLSVFRDATPASTGAGGAVDLCAVNLEHTAAGMPLSRAALEEGRAALGVDALVPGEAGRPPPSAYVRYQCAHALAQLVARTGWRPLDDGWLAPRMDEARAALERAALDAYRSLCEQLALLAAAADEGVDPVRLTYDLCTYYEASKALQRGAAFFAKPSRAPKVNLKLAAHALAAIFAAQKSTGLWQKGEPITSSFSFGSRDPIAAAASRELGNSFVFSFDCLDALLHTLGTDHPALFREHLGSIERTVGWAEASVVTSSGTAAWYAAAAAAREAAAAAAAASEAGGGGEAAAARAVDEAPQGEVRGWRSNHLEPGGPLCWSSAQVCSSVSSVRSLINRLSAEDVLAEFQASKTAGERSTRLFDSLMDSEVQLAGVGADGGAKSLKRILAQHILQPLADAPPGRPFESPLADAAGASPTEAKFSAILYGPPGTAKSTVCEAVARHLGWPLLTIDTADLLAAGLEQVAARMSYVFEKLLALERTVILFDEIEEFCLDRTEGKLSMESRMLTTAMLTQLNDLRRKQRCVFFVATNRIAAFDSAVTRPGRFDMILLVGTPSLEARVERLHAKLAGTALAEPGAAEAELRAALVGVLKDTWVSELQFFNYMENERLLDALVKLGGRAAAERRSPMAVFAEARETVAALASAIVLRGAARDDYVASRALSRV